GTAEVRNVVVTAGTGSGKTECFLLPIFARLLAEAETWGSSSALHRWWAGETDGPSWRHARSTDRRDAAVQAMILYPTNALVEDQIARLRRAVSIARSADPRACFYFGRYTGVTLGSGDLPTRSTDPRVREVSKDVLAMEQDFDRIRSRDLALLSQFPDPRSG